jgi:5'-nucleotidase
MSDAHKRSRLVVAVLLALVMALTWVPLANAGMPEAARVPFEQKAGREVQLQLLAINDYHGQIIPYSTSFVGAEYLSAYLDRREAEAKGPNSVTWRLGVGDLIGASPAVSGLLQDEPTLEVLDEMRFMYSCVGNHEFDEGIDELLRLQYGGFHPVTGHWERMKMKYLAANVVYEGTDETVFPGYVIEHARGIPVGIIGIVYEGTPSIVTASGVAGLEFLPEAEAVNNAVAELKAKGVKAIIVLMHNGGYGSDTGGPITGDIVPIIEAMDDEVDVVLTAHSHARYWGYIDGKLVTQAYNAGRAFADVDLVLSRDTKDVVSSKAEIVYTNPDATLLPDLKVLSIVEKALATVAPIVNEVVGVAAADITRTQNAAGESALGNLIADAQAWKQGTQIAFMNPGGIRAEIYAGEVTWGELFAVQPFANYLVTMEMTGAQIEAALEQQWAGQASPRMLQMHGIQYSWSASAPVGDKVDPAHVYVGGVPLDLAATYTVTANNFLAEGGDNFIIFRDATIKVYWGSDLDALVDYIKQLPQPFNAVIEGRVTVLP